MMIGTPPGQPPDARPEESCADTMAHLGSAALRAALRIVNRAGEGLARAGVELVSLDERRLVEAACRQTGISGFADDGFRDPFRHLLRALADEARLTLIGRIAARADIVGLLANRLRLEEDRRRHPAIADEEIRRPLFVVG